MKVVSFIVFIVIQAAFLPLAVIGLVLVTYTQLFVSRKLGVSSTAVEVINGRWALDVFGIRADPASVKLAGCLPNDSITGLWLVLFPLYVYFRLTGERLIYPRAPQSGNEGLADLMTARTLYFDDLVNRAGSEVEQFVVLGAGFDTRCYGELKETGWKLFELDQQKTQQLKISCLEQAGIDAKHVTFVPVDFSAEDWHDKLERAGYDRQRKTLFLWEGVTLYLAESDVCRTLGEIREHSAPGSIVIADIYSRSFVSGSYAPGMKTAKQTLKLTNEEFGFGLEFSVNHQQTLADFLTRQKMTPGKYYFLGAKNRKGPYMVVAEFSC
jgi:methyltransferase (TIGR00027 family)